MSPNFHSWIILNGKWVLWSISFELSPINHAWKSSIGPCCITARDSAPAESKTVIFLHFCRLRINVRLRDISFDWQWIYFGYPYVRIAWIIQLNFHPVQYLAEYVFKSNRNCVRRDRDTMSFRWRTTRDVFTLYSHSSHPKCCTWVCQDRRCGTLKLWKKPEGLKIEHKKRNIKIH